MINVLSTIAKSFIEIDAYVLVTIQLPSLVQYKRFGYCNRDNILQMLL